MNIQQFLAHYKIGINPFADEDAQTDQVFKSVCLQEIYHPTWDKIYGAPEHPSTSVVFGEKGAGKTALRLQMINKLRDHNATNRRHQVFVIAYDDFNPYLDRFRERFTGRKRKPTKLFEKIRLWDHIDAFLSLGVTQLIDRILGTNQSHPAATTEPLAVANLSSIERRDVMLLAMLYDQPTGESTENRWSSLRKKLHFSTWRTMDKTAIGLLCTAIIITLFFTVENAVDWLKHPWIYIALFAGWTPWIWKFFKNCWLSRKLYKNLKMLVHDKGVFRRLLGKFHPSFLTDQPLPAFERSDDRYKLLAKFQGVLATLGLDGTIVILDRADEPYLINGNANLMKAFIWPLLDNKLLKHERLGIKMLLPAELESQLDRENADFHQRSRLDKQNLIRSLSWTGESLYDLASARMQSCLDREAVEEEGAEVVAPKLTELFDASITRDRLLVAFASLRVPRHLFRFMYRLITAHCISCSEENPCWKIPATLFESELALYQRDQMALERGLGAG